MQVGEVFPIPQVGYQTPARSPTIQLNLDILYLEITSPLTEEGLHPTRQPPLPLSLQMQLQTQVITCASDRPAVD